MRRRFQSLALLSGIAAIAFTGCGERKPPTEEETTPGSRKARFQRPVPGNFGGGPPGAPRTGKPLPPTGPRTEAPPAAASSPDKKPATSGVPMPGP